MSSMSHLSWRMRAVLSCVFVVGFAVRANADPKPLSKEDQAKVDKAIDKAIVYLKRAQNKQGNWPIRWKNFLVGECALPAYALLEAGVPANDPVIQKAAAFIRPIALKTDSTYEISLAVLFFDRLGDPQDKTLIQSLALRLIAGQFYTGGWSYLCPKLKADQEANLRKGLEELSKRMEGGKTTKEALKGFEVPKRMERLVVFRSLEKFNWLERQSPKGVKESLPLVGRTDNSNTQFSLLALWAAQRHDVPTEPSFRLLAERFDRSQCRNGEWHYSFPYFGEGGLNVLRNGQGHRSMTCVGLLGLAIGRGEKLPGSSGPLPNDAVDGRILAGLAALHSLVGVPTGQMDRPVPPEDVYFLWSVERVGMLFNLPTLGNKEWYRWGAEILVTNQLATGEWPEKFDIEKSVFHINYGPVLYTSFALLFLKHSHPMKELTTKLPFTAKELNAKIVALRPGGKPLEGATADSQSRNTEPLERTTAQPSRKTKPDR